MNNHKVQIFSWLDIDRMVDELCQQIQRHDFQPDCIVGILRGGMIPAIYLSHKLQVDDVLPITIKTRLSDEVRASIGKAKVKYYGDGNLMTGKNVLLVDDVTNSGLTLQTALRLLDTYHPIEVKTAVLAVDTIVSEESINNVFHPDYQAFTVDAWIVFPWEDS